MLYVCVGGLSDFATINRGATWMPREVGVIDFLQLRCYFTHTYRPIFRFGK